MSNDNLEPRRDYTANTLSSNQLAESPVEQFSAWMQHAREKNILDATAMAIATAGSDGQPHVRMVLLKKFDETGFVWYTYQKSDKGLQLEENPQASILFYWRELERQVRIEGTVSKLDPSDADDYFHSRPIGSRFSAAASAQSSPVMNRTSLELTVKALHTEYPDGKVPRPAAWGGYKLAPKRFEFWQGREDRLHDRFIYAQEDAGNWFTQRLAP